MQNSKLKTGISEADRLRVDSASGVAVGSRRIAVAKRRRPGLRAAGQARFFFAMPCIRIAKFREDFPGPRPACPSVAFREGGSPVAAGTKGGRAGKTCNFLFQAKPLRAGTSRGPFWLRLRRAALFCGQSPCFPSVQSVKSAVKFRVRRRLVIGAGI